MNINEILKELMAKENLNQTELGEALGTTQQNIGKKFKNNSFYVKDLVKIAESLGYELKIEFVGGNDMQKELLIKKIKDKCLLEETGELESDEEYYFAMGQSTKLMLSRIKGLPTPYKKSIEHSILYAGNPKVLKEAFSKIIVKYFKFVPEEQYEKNLIAMVMDYEPENKKILENALQLGYTHSYIL